MPVQNDPRAKLSRSLAIFLHNDDTPLLGVDDNKTTATATKTTAPSVSCRLAIIRKDSGKASLFGKMVMSFDMGGVARCGARYDDTQHPLNIYATP